MGAIVALDYASTHPENVSKLVVIDPAISGDYRMNPLLKLPVISDVLMTAYWYPRAVSSQRKEFADKALFESYAERLRYFMAFKGYKHTNYSTWTNMLTQNRMDKLSALPLSHMLLIYGEKDPYFREAQCRKIQSRLPGLETVRIEWAGHMPHLEKPLEVNHAIHSFFSGADEFMFSWYQ
jgi:pimeloyl-ACP methyl ester carboxylesterase